MALSSWRYDDRYCGDSRYRWPSYPTLSVGSWLRECATPASVMDARTEEVDVDLEWSVIWLCSRPLERPLSHAGVGPRQFEAGGSVVTKDGAAGQGHGDHSMLWISRNAILPHCTFRGEVKLRLPLVESQFQPPRACEHRTCSWLNVIAQESPGPRHLNRSRCSVSYRRLLAHGSVSKDPRVTVRTSHPVSMASGHDRFEWGDP
ncbi:hypothetical protein VTG60DRAFT_2737 [Thermothelomyces hinnuleus]